MPTRKTGKPTKQDIARLARMDLWSQRELGELCVGWIPGTGNMSIEVACTINDAIEVISRGTHSGKLAFIPRDDADSAAIMYNQHRHYVPAVAAEWATLQFPDTFPAGLLAAVRKRVQTPKPGIGTLQHRENARTQNAPAMDNPQNTRWPWGDHETEYLRLLEQAVSRFWTLYDPADASTAPTNPQIEKWLKQQTVRGKPVSANVAQVMATILRADGLPHGPRK